jgi:hypothetical protein
VAEGRGPAVTQSQTISLSEAVLARRLHVYRALLLVSILGNLVICLWGIFDPASFGRFLHQPDPLPVGWIRAWGVALLGLQLVYVPGLSHPLFYRWPNWSGIAINFLLAIIFVVNGPAFYLLALWDFGFGVILLVAYYRLMIADVMREP